MNSFKHRRETTGDFKAAKVRHIYVFDFSCTALFWAVFGGGMDFPGHLMPRFEPFELDDDVEARGRDCDISCGFLTFLQVEHCRNHVRHESEWHRMVACLGGALKGDCTLVQPFLPHAIRICIGHAPH